jgi:hypothetical protein
MAAKIQIHISDTGAVSERQVPVDDGQCVEFLGPKGFSIGFTVDSPFGNEKPVDWQNPVTNPCHLIQGVEEYPYTVILNGMVTEPSPFTKLPGPIILPPPQD